MQLYYDKKIKTNKVEQSAGGFHIETLEKCQSLMKAITLKNRNLLKQGGAGYKIEKIKQGLLEEGEELYEENEEEDEDEEEKFQPEH